MKPETTITPEGKEMVLIHFLSNGRIVCMPNLLPKDMASNKERAVPHMRTDSAEGTTCSMCKKTKEWVDAKR